jgi:hypothetical protein
VLFSVSAAAAYVWHASHKQSRKTTPAAVVEENGPTPAPLVMDEEVRVTKESMLSTSKSGIIMQDSDIRKMLDDQKTAAARQEQERLLMPSSKSIEAMLSGSESKDIIEKNQRKPGETPDKPSQP